MGFFYLYMLHNKVFLSLRIFFFGIKKSPFRWGREPYIAPGFAVGKNSRKGGGVVHDFFLSKEQVDQFAFDWYDIIVADIQAEDEQGKGDDDMREEHTTEYPDTS